MDQKLKINLEWHKFQQSTDYDLQLKIANKMKYYNLVTSYISVLVLI